MSRAAKFEFCPASKFAVRDFLARVGCVPVLEQAPSPLTRVHSFADRMSNSQSKTCYATTSRLPPPCTRTTLISESFEDFEAEGKQDEHNR